MELNYHIPDVGKSLKECLETIAIDHNLYGLNSLRSGGATLLHCNPNLSQRVLRQASRTMEVRYCERYIYILEDVSKLLQVTSQLGL